MTTDHPKARLAMHMALLVQREILAADLARLQIIGSTQDIKAGYIATRDATHEALLQGNANAR